MHLHTNNGLLPPYLYTFSVITNEIYDVILDIMNRFALVKAVVAFKRLMRFRLCIYQRLLVSLTVVVRIQLILMTHMQHMG
ncbi:hypothetical protein F5Y13DRAFT_173356 [Hypoxylon sp. FL1857]|nr:hypothetical protein F5Y13DRAFT_173356 [Hypoxylon sp. FL1857]